MNLFMENSLTPFLSSFFILLREGFEAMLIAVLVFMYLDKVKANNKRPAVFWGIEIIWLKKKRRYFYRMSLLKGNW